MSDPTTKVFEEEKIIFNEGDHSYIGTTSKKSYMSVTSLLKKFGMSPSEYDMIPAEILEKKAAYGKAIHEALELFIGGDETQLIFPEVYEFNEWLKSQSLSTLDCVSEQVVFNEYYGIAGTIDVEIWNLLGDFKTTATLHLVPVMWQLSLYNFLRHPDEEKYAMHELRCFWFSAEGTLTVRPIPLIPYPRLISMLEAYKRGDEMWVDASVPTTLVEKIDMIVKQKRLIDTLKKNLAVLENEKDVIRGAIEDQMKEESRIYVDAPSGVVTLTEVAASRYDTEKVKKLINSIPGLIHKDYLKVSTYTRLNIKDKAKK